MKRSASWRAQTPNKTHTLRPREVIAAKTAPNLSKAPRRDTAQRSPGARTSPDKASLPPVPLLLLPPPLTHPGRSDVHHDLLEGGRLLGLPLGVQCYLLAELSRVGRPGAGARGGSGSTAA